MLFALDVAFYQMTELDQGRRNVYVMGGGGGAEKFLMEALDRWK